MIRYAADKYQSNIVFAQTVGKDGELGLRYLVTKVPTYLLFKENVSEPLRFTGDTRDDFIQFLEKNRFLRLPKLEFQNFGALCKSGKICVMLASTNESEISLMREMAKQQSSADIQMLWVSTDEQSKLYSYFNASKIFAIKSEKPWKYAIYSKEVTKESITQWISKLQSGKEKACKCSLFSHLFSS